MTRGVCFYNAKQRGTGSHALSGGALPALPDTHLSAKIPPTAIINHAALTAITSQVIFYKFANNNPITSWSNSGSDRDELCFGRGSNLRNQPGKGLIVKGGLAMQYSGRCVCTQPACLLKKAGSGLEDIADFLVRILAGEPLKEIVPGSDLIKPRPLCKHCALRVLSGKNAYRTEAEWSRLDDLGHWHYRRCQRSERRLC